MAEQNDLNVSAIAAIGGASVILTLVTIFAVKALYNSYATEEITKKVIEAPTNDSDSRIAEQDALLARYSWKNREDAVVTIPIEDAKRIVVSELRNTEPSRLDE